MARLDEGVAAERSGAAARLGEEEAGVGAAREGSGICGRGGARGGTAWRRREAWQRRCVAARGGCEGAPDQVPRALW